MKFLRTLLLATFLALAHASAETSIWSASVDNGDKPGIGFRLVQNERGITGAAYLLDPSYAHDFSHGAKHEMEIVAFKATEVRFIIDWGDGKRRTYILRFDAPLESKPVKGTLQEEPTDGEPTEFMFKRSK